MLLSILKALLSVYDNTIKEINKEVVEEKNIDDDILRNKIEEELRYATDNKLQELLEKENLAYMYNDFNYYGRYKIREILIDYYTKQRKIPY